MITKKISKRSIDAAQPGDKRYAVNDTELPGFKAYIHPSGRKSFHYRYRVGGGRGATIREPKVGEMGQMTPDQARSTAARWALEVRNGGDPMADRTRTRSTPTMNEVLDRYLTDWVEKHNKPRTRVENARMIDRYLRSALGRKKITEINRADIARLHNAHSDKPYQANRLLSLLSKVFNLAEVWELRPDGSNPCRHIGKFSEDSRQRFLSEEEIVALGRALRRAEAGNTAGASAKAAQVVRMLIFTGARKDEILKLKWQWINLKERCITLPDSKTGTKQIFLPEPAVELLCAITRFQDNPHVFVGGKPGTALVNIKDPWNAIRKDAGLDDLRLHDLRHSFASIAAGSGYSIRMIGQLLGHTNAQTTQRYAHLAARPQTEAADHIGAQIDRHLSKG